MSDIKLLIKKPFAEKRYLSDCDMKFLHLKTKSTFTFFNIFFIFYLKTDVSLENLLLA